MERVVITGMGTINPLGLDVPSSWTKLTNGESGIGPITRFDASELQVEIAGEINSFDPTEVLGAREARRRDRFEQFASAATSQAMEQSGLEINESNAGRTAVIISTGVGGLESLFEGFIKIEREGPRRISPFVVPMFMPNGASGLVAIDTGAKGPTYAVASACASGADGIGQAWILLRAGIVDTAIAGGSEATINLLSLAAFERVRALSSRGSDFSPSPFDRDRDGLVMGEGAGVMVMETESHARQRGAQILAEVAGYSSTADSFHITAPSETGAGGAAAIIQAIERAGVNPDEVDYVNAHGTGTVLNDLSETKAIKTGLGPHAYDVAISSTKSMMGHIMGATGAIEAIICVKAIEENLIPPTIHLNNPDPECDLDYVPNQPRERNVELAISNAFGFGGHNAVLVIRSFSD